jgi:dolichol kinase
MFLSVVYALVLYGAVMFLSELGFRLGFNTFITRKIAHIFCGIITALLPLFVPQMGIIITGLLLASLVVFTNALQVFKGVERGNEFSLGTLFFPIGFVGAAFVFLNESPAIFSGAALVLGFADSLGALAGNYFGKKKLPNSPKSYLGMIVFALVMIVICFGTYYFKNSSFADFTLVKLAIVIVGSTIVSGIEAISKYGADNLFIPVSAGLVLYLVI